MKLEHSSDCWKRAIGETVLEEIEAGHDLSLEGVVELTEEFQRSGLIPCDCAKQALKHLENQLRLARKARRAWQAKYPSEEVKSRLLDKRVGDLIEQRDELNSLL